MEVSKTKWHNNIATQIGVKLLCPLKPPYTTYDYNIKLSYLSMLKK